MNIRPLDRSERSEAIALALDVFTTCGTADYDADGLETFKSFVGNNELMNELSFFGAFHADRLVGIIGTKNSGAHISLLFIAPHFQRKGVGRKLFDCAYANLEVKEITVNSSSFAVTFYQSIGFALVADQQVTNGLRYTPMRRRL